MADALGTPGGVVSDEDHRLAQAGLIAPQTSSLAVRTGVMWGPGSTALVTGTSATGTMTYAIAAHHAVTTRSTADGVYLGPTLEAATTVPTTAAPGSNSRIDVIWERQTDAASTVSPDGATAPEYGVTQGTAAVSPTKPSIPVGAVELATATVAAGATSTNGAGVTITNTARQTVARGAPIPVRNQTERDALTTYPLLTVLRLDTGDIEMRNAANSAWVTVYDAVPTAPTWTTLSLIGSVAQYNGDGSGLSASFEPFGYRAEGIERGWLRGWLTTAGGVAVNTAVNSVALPVSMRPSKARTIYPLNDPAATATPTRFEIGPDGFIYTLRSLAAGAYVCFDECSWALG